MTPAGRGHPKDGERSSGPPLGRLVLRFVVPRERRADLVGDLGEIYAARRRNVGVLRAWAWYWRQVVDSARRFALERGRERRQTLADRIPLHGPDAGSPAAAVAAPGHGPRAAPISATDLRLALRMMGKTPALTAVAVVAMAVGIGLSITVFGITDQLLYGELPFPEGDRIMRLQEWFVEGGYPVRNEARAFTERRLRLTTFEDVVGHETRRVSLEHEGGALVVSLAWVTPNIFDMVRVQPFLGRGFMAGDIAPGAPAVTVIGHGLWRTQFGADPDVLGTVVRLEGEQRTIVGVMPEGFVFPADNQVWAPVQTDPAAPNVTTMRIGAIGRLADGVSAQQAQAELQAIGARVPPQEYYSADQVVQRVIPFTRMQSGEGQLIAAAMIGLVALIMLITAANVANLLLARTSSRMNELAVRVALGATRGRIVTQLLAESLVLGGLAALIGVAASRPALSWFEVVGDVPWWADFGLDPSVVGFAVVVTVLASAIAGLSPALKATRAAFHDVLKDESLGASGMRFGRLSSALLMAQVTISVALLSTAAVLALGIVEYSRFREHGFPEIEVLVAQLYFGQPTEQDRGPTQAESWANFTDRVELERLRIEERIREVPGFRSVAFGSHFPGHEDLTRRVVQVAKPGTASESLPSFAGNSIDIGPGYFELLDVHPLAGRDFTPADHEGVAEVAIVNDRFVRKHLGGGSTLGRRVRIGRATDNDDEVVWQPWMEIVGVVPDIGVNPADPSNGDAIYRPMQPANFVYLAVRTYADPALVTPALYEAAGVDTMKIHVQVVWTLEELVAGPTTALGNFGRVAVLVGAIALLLSASALYAVMAFSVSRRTREIGIRLALGAASSKILAAILGRSLMPLLLGAVLGAALGAASTVLLGVFLPLTALGTVPLLALVVSAVMVAVGLVASLVPARRALAVQPMDALRKT